MSQPSNLTAQALIDYARANGVPNAILGVSGYSSEPAVSFLDDIVKKIMNKANPWKWNQIVAPIFYTQPYQQDYPTSIAQGNMGWLEACTMIDINNYSQQPPPQGPVNCVARIQPTSALGWPTKISWVTNSTAQLGVWPGANIVYQQPLVSLGGGPGNNPLTAILDPNGNIQVVTTYGTTGSGPSWPAASAAAGTTTPDGTVVWTVQDPNGIAFRLDRLATNNSNVFQMKPTYQNKPPNITTLKQTISPIPDDMSYLVKAGFLAYCYRSTDPERFRQEFGQWMMDVQEALGASDREYQEFGFAPSQSLVNGPSVGGNSYPGWPGWSSDGY